VPEEKALLNFIFVATNEYQTLYPNSMSDDEEEQAGEAEEEEEAENEEYNDELDYEKGEQADEFADVEIDNGDGIIEDQPIMDVQ
jgi:hypothetical protein